MTSPPPLILLFSLGCSFLEFLGKNMNINMKKIIMAKCNCNGNDTSTGYGDGGRCCGDCFVCACVRFDAFC